MQFSLVLAVMASTASAAAMGKSKQMQINYYSDSTCHSFQGNVDVTWATSLYDSKHNNCYNYQYGNSVNIAECDVKAGCLCNFYYQKDCTGGATQQLQGNGNCVGGAQQLKSFACYYR
ncbi:hypothetical protein VHEMI04732 [[Torrubiella] hemipterigena]|uniref:Uncharacterized protein n=1 Tax=[Torrubiella] hemipterigena TaxID=1531966 RepID=A0A0A1T221_9HYPO|nr:hypothetical protein VHEMI04732 [[Torrubiella] hemipterigena]